MPRELFISVADQRLTLREGERVLFSAPVSTGAAGVGFAPGSGCTPTGRFVIATRHGENAPEMTIFRARVPAGVFVPGTEAEDAILSRILTLDGLEPENANTLSRYIYIHGTNDTARLGTPVSHGCIRLSPADAVALFPLVPLGTHVTITA